MASQMMRNRYKEFQKLKFSKAILAKNVVLDDSWETLLSQNIKIVTFIFAL